MDSWTLLADVVILLAASLLLGGIFSRFGQSPIVGYLLAGMVLGGPGSIDLVRSQNAIEAIAELGVSLLLFSLGLEFSWARLTKLGVKSLLAGVLQVVLTTVLGAVTAYLAGLGLNEAVAVGAMVSLSSTAVVLRVLLERAESDSVHGRACVAILLVQDMAVVPLAMLMAMLVGGESATDVAVNAGRVVLLAAGLVIVLYVIVDMLAVRVLKRLTLDQNRELSMLLAVVTGLGSACAAHYVHVSPALGAFVAGMFLGSSPFATQIRSDVSPLRIVLLTLFFGAAGMVADPVWIFHNLPVVLGVSLGLMLGKTAVMWVILQGLGRTAPIAAASGIALSQIGEFAFVLGSIGRAGGVVSDETYRLIVSVAIVTLIVSPVLIPFAPSLGMRLASWLPGARPYAREEGAGEANSPDVVIVGFGPAGQIAANVFVGQPERVLVIDLNKEGVQKARELGFDGHVGDATQFDVLSHIPISSAKAVVITVPHHGTAMRILEHVRSLAPHTHLVVRSRHQRESADLTKAGADTVIGDEEQVGDMLGRHLSEWQRRNSE